MKEIVKHGNDPRILIEFKDGCLDGETGNYINCECTSFREREAYKRILLTEQHYLCAYCNKQIEESNSTIEHWLPQNKCKTLPTYRTPSGEDINHQNLIAVCLGNNENPHFHHCDNQRGKLKSEDQRLTIKPQDPHYLFAQTFTYIAGKLMSIDSETIQDDVDRKLNLNHQTLINFRNITFSQFIKNLSGDTSRATLSHQLERYSTPNAEGKLKKFCTVITNYIEKKLALSN